MGVYLLLARGVDIWSAPGTEMWQRDDVGSYMEIGEGWSWSVTKHYHYLVKLIDNPPGGYWVPVSTHPPAKWKNWWTAIEGSYPPGAYPLNKASNQFRPIGTFIWIPKSFFSRGNQNNYCIYEKSNYVVCTETVPTTYPPKDPVKEKIGKEKKESKSNKNGVVFSFSPEKSSTPSNSPSRSPSSGATSMDIDE